MLEKEIRLIVKTKKFIITRKNESSCNEEKSYK